MKVVVSSTGENLESQIDPRFGRCSFFLIIDTEDMSFESFNNENLALSGGAGIQSASFVASKEVKAVLTGNCGPKAMQVFSTAGVDVFTGFSGNVKDAVEQFKKGGLNPTTEATVGEKAGVSNNPASGNVQPQNAGQGMGQDRGMGGGGRCMGGSGRGMGMGGGKGSGRGMGMGGGKGGGRGMGGCRGGGRKSGGM